jgi:hypothetical protein
MKSNFASKTSNKFLEKYGKILVEPHKERKTVIPVKKVETGISRIGVTKKSHADTNVKMAKKSQNANRKIAQKVRKFSGKNHKAKK